MKTRKTRTDARNTFTYKFADGTSVVLTPGVDGVTEADIAMLHRLDDCEVRNNVKHSRASIEDWEKPYIEEWKAQNPEEEYPVKYHASLDYFASAEGDDMDSDQSRLFSECAVEMEGESAETQAVRDFVDAYLTEDQKLIYQRVLIDGDRIEDVAEELGVSFQAVPKRAKHIKKIFRENFKNFMGQVEK